MSDTQAAENTAPAKAKTEIHEVTMTDGRVAKFAGKRQVNKEVLADDQGNPTGVRFDFASGETRSLLFSEIPAKTALQLLAHGANQKIGDDFAGEKKVDDMVLSAEEMMKRLRSGEFYAAREAGDSFSGASVVIRALCEVTGKTKDDIKKFLDGKLEAAKAAGQKLSRAELYKAFRNPDSKTGQVIARIEREDAAKDSKVSAAELESELGV